MVVVLDHFPSALEPDLRDPDFEKKQKEQAQLNRELNNLRPLLRKHLWNGVPAIYSWRELASNVDGGSSEVYLKTISSRARYLGEIVPFRIAA